MLEFGGETLIVTHDMMVEGVHWLPEQDPADVAWKLLATNLSDLAAKGAEPIGVLLGYTLTEDNARFAAGLGEALYSRLEAVEHRSGMEIEFEARGELEKLPADLFGSI